MPRLPFTKMHGLGNDFVVLDARRNDITITTAEAAWICDRHTGIGCDQILVLHPPPDDTTNVFMRIYNRSGDALAVCANGTRCVASLMFAELTTDRSVVGTVAGPLVARQTDDGLVALEMKAIRFGWQEIPLTADLDTLFVPVGIDGLPEAVCSNIGNSHATFFVDDIDAFDLTALGPRLENHPVFAHSTNIGLASIIDRHRMRLRVWETGSGVTLAYGTGACAAAVAAARRGLTDRAVEVVMAKGSLFVDWTATGQVVLTGRAETSFTGSIAMSILPHIVTAGSTTSVGAASAEPIGS